MSTAETRVIIEKLKFLSECINKKCEKLSKHSPGGKKLLIQELKKLCDTIKKNCEVFENELGGSSTDSNFIITINLLDIIGEDNCKNLRKNDVERFKNDLGSFAKTYLTETRDPVFNNLYQLFYSDSQKNNVDSTPTHDVSSSSNVVRDIFGSDTDDANSLSNNKETSSGKGPTPLLITSSNEVDADTNLSSKDSEDGLLPPLTESGDKGIAELVEHQPQSENSKEQLVANSQEDTSSSSSEVIIETSEVKDAVNSSSDHNNSKKLEEKVDESSSKENLLKVNTEEASSSQENIEDCISSDNLKESQKNLQSTNEDTNFTSADSTSSIDKNIECEPSLLEQKRSGDVHKESDPEIFDTEKSTDQNVCDEEVSVAHSVDSAVDSSSRQIDIENSAASEKSLEDFQETEIGSLDNMQGDKDSDEESQEAVVNSQLTTTESTFDNQNSESSDEEVIPSPKGLNEDSDATIVESQFSLDKEKNGEEKNLFFSNLGLSQTTNCEKAKIIRDELLSLLVEVDYQDDTRVLKEMPDRHASSSDSSDYDDEKYGERNALAALKELEEDSSDDDIGLSGESELDLSSLDIDSMLSDEDVKKTSNGASTIPVFVPRKCTVILERQDLETLRQELNDTRKSTNFIREEPEGSNFAAKDCSVVLKPFRIEEDSSASEEGHNEKVVDEDAEINRLCQLSTLEKKRSRDSENKTERKIKRKRRRIDLSGSDTPDMSGYSSVSESEIKEERLLEEGNDDTFPIDPNSLLAEIVCHTIHDSDSDSSSAVSSDNEEEKTKKRNRSVKTETDSQKEGEAEKEKRESWRDDPLLRGNLKVPSDKEKKDGEPTRKRSLSLDDETECAKSKKIRTSLKSKYLDPDQSDSLDSADDFEDTFIEKKIKKKTSDEDSDIEIIGSSTSNVINVDSDEEADSKKNTRRNILSVLSSEKLTESTQRAAEDEEARIVRLEKQKQLRCSQESLSSEQEGVILDVSADGSRIVVDPNLSKKLYTHQIKGVKFMWDACYLSVDSMKKFSGTGCILAHNMGLGKTFQVVTLVHTLFNHPVTNTKHVLIVCPLSTVSGWKKEFLNALKIVQQKKDIMIDTIESKDASRIKCSMVIRWKREGGVLVMGYEAFSRMCKDDDSYYSKLLLEALINPGPDLVVCDEGHLLKNGKTVRTQSLMRIRTKRRIALTGTPLQNNLEEYYFMVQFVKPNLLGNKTEFNRNFINPIMNGQYEDSLEHDITLMKKRTHVLHRLLKNTVQRFEASELHRYLDNMNDYALFIQLHPIQEKLYRTYIQTVRRVMDGDTKKNIKSFFMDYQILKYICSHPQLLQTMETQRRQMKRNEIRELDVISEEPEIQVAEGLPQDWWKPECPDEIKTNIEFGTKLHVMMSIIEEAEKAEEKVLIFTSSLVELSSVEYFLKLIGTSKCPSWKTKRDYFRMDGTVPPSVRTKMCDMFNDETNKTLRLFLMSHKVGGLGLNLVAANRVILLGANFNPSLDSQSIYRAYRFGQTKKVYIYRLLSKGTMEEKIYHRCVTKLAIASRVVDKHQIARHYKNLDLEDLYRVEIDLNLPRPTPAKPDDAILSSVLLKFDCIYKYHHHQKLLENLPDEDLNEEDQRKAWEEFEQMNERERNMAEKSTAPAVSNLVQTMMNHLKLPQQPQLLRPLNTPWPNMRMLPRYQEVLNAIIQSQETIGATGIPPIPMNGAQRHSSQPVGMVRAPGSANIRGNPGSVPPRHHSNMMPLVQGNIKSWSQSAMATKDAAGNTARNRSVTTTNGGDTSTINLQNSNPSRVQTGKNSKTISSAIGPNPLFLVNFQNRKENVETAPNSSKSTWRTSSSDDFQSAGSSNTYPVTKSGNSVVSNSRRSQKETDNVVVIDISDDTTTIAENNRRMFEKQLDVLRKRNLTVTSTRKQDEAPPVIDIT